MKKLLSVLFALFLIACANPDISGTWVQPVPNMPTMTQGFILNPDGTAESVNMATLQYDTWTLNGNELTMTGRSIGNGQTNRPYGRFLFKTLAQCFTCIMRIHAFIAYFFGGLDFLFD